MAVSEMQHRAANIRGQVRGAEPNDLAECPRFYWNKTGTLGISLLYVDKQDRHASPQAASV
jgi:hypothetical protein